jgi:hypothetical protein
LRARAEKISEIFITTELFEIANISTLDFDGPPRRGRSTIIKNYDGQTIAVITKQKFAHLVTRRKG